MIVNGSLFREIESNSWDVETRLAECDAAGVDVQVLSTVPVMFSYWAEPDPALELARHLNDHIAGVVAAHPGALRRPRNDPDAEPRPRDPGARALRAGARALGRRDRLERQRSESRQPGALSDLRGGRVARRRRLRPPVGDGRPGSDDALLAPLARRDARGDVARDLLAHLRRRAREAAGPADRLRARRRRLSGDDRANRPRLRRAARSVRRFATTSRRASTCGGSTSTRSCTIR